MDPDLQVEESSAPGWPELPWRAEVRTRFDGRWVGGFEVVGFDGAALLVRRLSDGTLLRGAFTEDEIRPLG